MPKPDRKRPTTVWLAGVINGPTQRAVVAKALSTGLFYDRAWRTPRRFVAVDDLRKMTRVELEAWLRRPR
jgi:hypothetical protein